MSVTPDPSLKEKRRAQRTLWIVVGLVLFFNLILIIKLILVSGCKPPPPPAPPPPTLSDQAASLGDLKINVDRRKQTLQQLVQSLEGCQLVLALAKGNLLPADLKVMATMEFCNSPYPAIRQESATVLPPFLDKSGQPLPRLAELVQRTGDLANGKAVFNRPDVNCVGCHIIRGQGVSVGPELTQIATTLKRQSLWEEMLEPNAVITPKYETWQIMLKSGEEIIGVITGETTQEILITDKKGTAHQLKAGDIQSRKQLPISIMPTGLQQTLTLAELVDLMEYLDSLK